jgi:hypothetical protein
VRLTPPAVLDADDLAWLERAVDRAGWVLAERFAHLVPAVTA